MLILIVPWLNMACTLHWTSQIEESAWSMPQSWLAWATRKIFSTIHPRRHQLQQLYSDWLSGKLLPWHSLWGRPIHSDARVLLVTIRICVQSTRGIQGEGLWETSLEIHHPHGFRISGIWHQWSWVVCSWIFFLASQFRKQHSQWEGQVKLHSDEVAGSDYYKACYELEV